MTAKTDQKPEKTEIQQRDDAVLAFIRRKKTVTVHMVAEELGVSRGTAATSLFRLLGRPQGGHGGTATKPDEVRIVKTDDGYKAKAKQKSS